MTKAKIQTGGYDDHKRRILEKARKLDRGEPLASSVTLTFEDPADLATLLTKTKLELLKEIRRHPASIAALAEALNRDRRAVSRDVSALERHGLVKTVEESNPGHGRRKRVVAEAMSFEVVATI